MDLFNITQMFHRYCHGCPELEIELIEPEKIPPVEKNHVLICPSGDRGVG